jgi:C1A family cysteine protease
MAAGVSERTKNLNKTLKSGAARNAEDVVPSGPVFPVGIEYYGRQVQPDPVGPTFPVLAANRKLSIRNRQWYGWHPDLPDSRDHLFAPATVLSLPPKLDLRSTYSQPPIYTQGPLGSCSGNAIAAAIHFERIRQGLPDAIRVPSRLFIYYNERAIERTVESDSGSQIRDGIKSVASQGHCFESGQNSWPYFIKKFKTRPPAACYSAARKDRVISYSRVLHILDHLKICLASGYPLICGFVVFQSFEGKQVGRTGLVPMPSIGERPIGGHAALAVGYDDTSERFIVRNSWGADWGRGGYFTIPYTYFTHPGLARDFWTIRLV